MSRRRPAVPIGDGLGGPAGEVAKDRCGDALRILHRPEVGEVVVALERCIAQRLRDKRGDEGGRLTQAGGASAGHHGRAGDRREAGEILGVPLENTRASFSPEQQS